MSGLYVGVSGLTSNQASLNTTAHNLANVDTKGYVRQQIVISDTRYNNLGVTHFNTLQKGLGSSIMSVRQVRENFLDQAYRREIGRQAFYDAQAESVKEIEDLFGELEGVAFQKSLEEFWTALQEVSKEPGNIATRSSVISTGVSFIERAEKITKQLDSYQINLNNKITQYVHDVNKIANQIKELNTKIRRYESSGVENANDLRDERNNLLDDLGKIVNISYVERANGIVEVSVEGMQLVTEDYVYKMGTAKMSEDSPMLVPTWVENGHIGVYNLDNLPKSSLNTDIGALQGLLYARGNKVAKYTDIPVKEDYIDENGVFEEKRFESDVMEYNKTIEASIVTSTRAKFDQLIHGIVTMVNDVLSPNKQVELVDGSKIFILDKENAPIGMDDNASQGEALFNRKSMDRYREETITIVNELGDEETFVAMVYNEENVDDNYSLFTIGEIEINPKIMNNNSKLPLSSNTGTSEYDIKVAEELIKRWQEPFATLSPNTLTRNTINEYYISFISDIANKGQQFIKKSENQSVMVNDLDNQRMGVTGVSSDEELTALIKYQHGYNASARYVNVVSEMLEHIIMRLA